MPVQVKHDGPLQHIPFNISRGVSFSLWPYDFMNLEADSQTLFHESKLTTPAKLGTYYMIPYYRAWYSWQDPMKRQAFSGM